MGEITWNEVKEAATNNYLMILPVGSTEQHGPHLPLSTDVIIANRFALAIAEKTKAIVAPAIQYGYYSRPKSGGGESFPGTTSLSASLIIGTIKDICLSLMRQGFSRFLILNGHYENIAILPEGFEQAIQLNENRRGKSVVMTWTDALNNETLADLFGDAYPGPQTDHASLTETSLMMFLRPDLVRLELIPKDRVKRVVNYDIIPAPEDTITNSGSLWTAVGSSKEKGKKLFEIVVQNILKIISKDLTME